MATFAGRDRSLITALSVLTADNKSHLLYQAIADASCRADLNPEELITISLQLRSLIFASDRVSDEPMYTLYDHMLSRFTKLIGETGQYILASERCRNRVVILTEQLLNEKHSPTQVVCNLKYYLERAGYDVEVLVTNFGELDCPESLWMADRFVLNNVLDVNFDFKTRLFDQEITGRNIVLQDGIALDGIKDALDYIKNVSPAFVISVGGNNVIADLASRFITVIVSSLTAKLPITRSKIDHE